MIGSRKFLAEASKMWCGFWKPRRKFGYVAGRIWPAQTNHFQTFSAGCKNWCGFWKPRMFQGLAILSHLEHKEYEDDGFAQNPLNCDWVSGNPIAIQVLNGGVEAWLTVALWFGVFFRGCAFGARCGGCALGVRFSFDTPPCILEDAGFIGLGRTLPPVIP